MHIQLSDHFNVRRLLRFALPMTMAIISLIVKRKKYQYW